MKQWNAYHKRFGEEAKRQAGEPNDRELKDIQSLDALESMMLFFEDLNK